jgi:gluconolactonase
MTCRLIFVLLVLIPACWAQLEIAATVAVTQGPATAAATAFTEGPAADAEGKVYFSELRSQRIMILSTNGVLSTFRENSNGANGLIFDSQWRLLACEASRDKPRVTRTDLKTGRIEVLAELYEGKPLNSPNDLTIDGKGRIYFTDQGRRDNSAVYRIDPDGRLTRILAAPDIQTPNGIVISPDDRTLYLVESNGAEGGARMIRAYDLLPDGAVGNMRVFYNFYPGRSADGMTIDTAGNIYAAAGLHRTRGTSETLDTKPGIHVISPKGQLLEYIPTPEDTVTNCAFGGPDMKTLYVTAGKTLYKVRTKVAGTRR